MNYTWSVYLIATVKLLNRVKNVVKEVLCFKATVGTRANEKTFHKVIQVDVSS